MRRLWALIRQRCPRCLTGRVFKGRLDMAKECGDCGHVFARGEGGYFLGAMYFSYPLAVVVIGIFCLLLHVLFPEWSGNRVLFTSWGLLLPFVPAIFRYSRVIWMHMDVFVEDQIKGTL